MTNATVITGSNDDATGKPSFGWLFATITAFGLLLFLAVSFASYHRRLMLRRKKEAEYNRFFRFLRPDSERFDKKITGVRSILTNTHSFDSSFINADAENYNKGFGGEGNDDCVIDIEKENENKQKISYANWVEKRHDESVERSDHDIFLQSVLARQVLLADMHSDLILKQSNRKAIDAIERIKAAHSETFVDCKYSSIPSTKRESILHDEYILQNRQNVVSQRESKMKHCVEINSNQSEMLKKKTLLKPVKRMKKKLGFQSYIFKKSATSLDEESLDTFLFYNEPRRFSEPSLFLHNEEAADPENLNPYNDQNQILLNPYYTDVSILKNNVEKRQKSTDDYDKDIDVFKSCPFKHDLSLPSDEDAQVQASTWM